MAKHNFFNLTGKILIASPYTMEDDVFHKSLIYIAHHEQQGAIGLIFNHPVSNGPIDSLLKKSDLNIDLSNFDLNIHLGGPIELERGFILHSKEYNKNTLFESQNSDLAVSSNLEILKDIAKEQGPQNSMFMVGYTGWSENQLEDEIKKNLWLILDEDQELIFSRESEDKWQLALSKLGINEAEYSPIMGMS